MNLNPMIKIALQEDLGSGDVTTELTVSPNIKGKAIITAKENGVMAGGIVVEKIFKTIDKNIKYKQFVSEGAKFKKGEDVCKIEGKLSSILHGERTALNFLSILSGIASLTNKFVEKVKPTRVKILDTRKTLPGLRELSKYAVKCGGGKNHRKGLWDMILIKDNHIEASGGIQKAIYKIQDTRCKIQGLKTEIEVKNLSELKIALGSKIDRIMLDNMDVKGMREAVKLARKLTPKIELEASGGVNLDNVYDIAKTGVDYISVGAITHSAKAIDFSLNVEMEKKN
ncbi:MAG: carboxylating nicotinate-nucleotide diphosphorylase [bacterium]|nr:carboxylating nicotinate-nucleotide diphosphorylase [bacterium]